MTRRELVDPPPPEHTEPVLVPDVVELVDRYLPELRPGPAIDRVAAYFALSFLVLLVGVAGMNVYGWVGAAVVGLLTALGGAGFIERYRRSVEASFRDRAEHRPWEFYGEIAERFRRDLEGQRARLLGPRSEWGRARAPLETALHEARRSQAYWEERRAQDPSSTTVASNLATARELSNKFESAVAELDGRGRILLDFFNACEAKLSVLEHSQRDVEESRRLDALSQRAEGVTRDAEAAMRGIGHDVLRRALAMGEALGAAERLRLRDVAGDLPVDRIEEVADRILASADAERRALAELVAAVDDGE